MHVKHTSIRPKLKGVVQKLNKIFIMMANNENFVPCLSPFEIKMPFLTFFCLFSDRSFANVLYYKLRRTSLFINQIHWGKISKLALPLVIFPMVSST